MNTTTASVTILVVRVHQYADSLGRRNVYLDTETIHGTAAEEILAAREVVASADVTRLLADWQRPDRPVRWAEEVHDLTLEWRRSDDGRFRATRLALDHLKAVEANHPLADPLSRRALEARLRYAERHGLCPAHRLSSIDRATACHLLGMVDLAAEWEALATLV